LEIAILLEKKYSLRSIARVLSRGKSTISYEVKENSTSGIYDPKKADAKARLRKRMRRFQWSKIEEHPELKAFIIQKLCVHWNPDEISGYMKKHRREAGYLSKTAIYQWLRTARGERYCTHLYSGRKRVKRRKEKKTERVLIPYRVGIAERSAGATNRTRYGHTESDMIVGRKGTPGGLTVICERKSRLVRARKVTSMRPTEHAEAERIMLADTKTLSITRDNGIENRDHEQVGIPSFFCDPYAPWQKGSVENANKMIRRYFPKGTDFRDISQRNIDDALSLINEKPRRILGYRSAREVAENSGMIRDIKRECVLTEG
jgi:IS30 family transposase